MNRTRKNAAPAKRISGREAAAALLVEQLLEARYDEERAQGLAQQPLGRAAQNSAARHHGAFRAKLLEELCALLERQGWVMDGAAIAMDRQRQDIAIGRAA